MTTANAAFFWFKLTFMQTLKAHSKGTSSSAFSEFESHLTKTE